MAKVIPIGQPANDAERTAIAHLRDHLPDRFILLHNFEIERQGERFEIDLALLAPHALYLIDVKGTRGLIDVHGPKWYPDGRAPYPSPLAKLRGHARTIKGLITRAHPGRAELDGVYVDAIVLLTAPDAHLNDPADQDGKSVVKLLTEALPPLRGALETVLADLRASGWACADEPALARFMLTAKVDDFDPAAVGAALFEVGLLPDFELLAQPERAPARIGRNRECVERITGSTRSERARALDLGLRAPAFCKQLGEYFARTGVANPRDWTHRIVKDRAHWPLAFNRWVFDDGGIEPDSIFIGDLELPDLPVVGNDEADPKLAELIGQRILPISRTGLRKFTVAVRVDPVPAKVEGLSRFVAEVVSRDNGPTGLRRRKAAWTRAVDTAKIAFSAIGRIEWEEGWHFVRVYAETRDGERIPLVDNRCEPLPRSPAAGEQAAPNESDLFCVLTDE